MKTSAGTKFGKTEQGTVWLDAERTSTFQFYQFWLNTQDSDVITYLRCFTFLDRAAIDALESVTKSAPEKREAQRVLAREVTTMVHGADEASRAAQGSERLFAVLSAEQSPDELLDALGDVPSTNVTASALTEERPLAQWLVDTKLASSKSEATRLIKGGGIYVNNVAMSDEKARLGLKDLWQKKLILLGKGKRQKHVLKLTE
jgi:tyrosyl-tRNA synthetase